MTGPTPHLKGNDLWDFLCQPKVAKTPALTKAEKRRRKKERAAAAFAEMKEAIHQATAAIDLWAPTARVLIFYKVTCSHCGAEHLQPELHLSEKPLVRLRHKRTGEERISRRGWSETPGSLPKVVQQISATTTHCLSCLSPEAEVEAHTTATQLELF